jgi:lipid II:glycine glycyltransferase (peptidoglycan interpeptide bridge formation enzyme)
MWQGMKGRSRTAVRKAEKSGLRACIRPVKGADVNDGSPFRALYGSTMMRLGAGRSYLFTDAYYAHLVAGLGDDLLLAEVRDPSHEVVAASLLMRHAPYLHYHLSASTPDAARLGANNLMIWNSMSFGSEAGLKLFHIGGGRRGQDDLFKFKQSFGGLERHFTASGVVVDEERYAELNRRRARAAGIDISEFESANFFPLYRQSRGDSL